MSKLIYYQNSKNGKIYKKTKTNLSKIVLAHKNYKIKFKNFKLHIILLTGYYAGYILDFHKNPLVKKYFTKDESVNISKIKGAYKIHGGFTQKEGFDCGHINDIKVGFTKNFKGKTFKTHKFVESELKKFVNSIIKISNKRKETEKGKVMKGGDTFDIPGTRHIKYCTQRMGGEDYLYNTRNKQSVKLSEVTKGVISGTTQYNNGITKLRDYWINTYPSASNETLNYIFSKSHWRKDVMYQAIITMAQYLQNGQNDYKNTLKIRMSVRPAVVEEIIKGLTDIQLNKKLMQVIETETTPIAAIHIIKREFKKLRKLPNFLFGFIIRKILEEDSKIGRILEDITVTQCISLIQDKLEKTELELYVSETSNPIYEERSALLVINYDGNAYDISFIKNSDKKWQFSFTLSDVLSLALVKEYHKTHTVGGISSYGLKQDISEFDTLYNKIVNELAISLGDDLNKVLVLQIEEIPHGGGGCCTSRPSHEIYELDQKEGSYTVMPEANQSFSRIVISENHTHRLILLT